ncbi:MAG TPA: hypothetical protein VGQ83_05390 [Polyangia bacterium]|jgi:hypothetical protein
MLSHVVVRRRVVAGVVLGAVFVVGCTSPPAPPSSTAAAALGSSTSRSGGSPTGSGTQVDVGLDAMTSSAFLAHLGVEAYLATLMRARADATRYLDRFEQRLLGGADARLPAQPSVPLGALRRQAPSRTTVLAARIRERFRGRLAPRVDRELERLALGGEILDVEILSVTRRGGRASIPDAQVEAELRNPTGERCTPKVLDLVWAGGGRASLALGAGPLEPGARVTVQVAVHGPAATFTGPNDVGPTARADCVPR